MTARSVRFALAALALSMALAQSSHAQDRTTVKKLVGGKLELKTSQQLEKLRQFAGTPFTLQRAPISRESKTSSAALAQMRDFFAAPEIAQTIRDLETSAHWKLDEHSCRPLAARSGLVLVTRVDARHHHSSQELRAYQAAQALRCYLFARLGTWPALWQATTLPECPDLPRDGVLVEVGTQPPEDERIPGWHDAQFERCADALQAHAGR